MVLPCREAWCPNYQPCPQHPIRPFGGGQPMPPGWAALSAACLARDGYRCRHCGGVATEADHIDPDGPNDLRNLQALCRPCHLIKTGRAGGLAS
jgi:hypothetical protein